MNSVDMKNILDNMQDIPSMPNVISKALKTIQNPNSSANQLAEIISVDQSLTTQVLKLVNSAYYGLSTQITSVNKAIALLGHIKVKNIIMSVAMKPMMMTHGGKALWEHSLRCAVGCEILATNLKTADPDEAFVIGFLHDIGKTVLQIYKPAASAKVNELVALGANRLEAEKMMFGFDHTQIGAELILNWKLPAILSNNIKYHHAPHISSVASSAAIVYVANKLVQEPLQHPILEQDVMDRLDLDLPDPQVLREVIMNKSSTLIRALK